MLDRLPLRELWLWLLVDCISPGPGIAGSLSAKLFMRLERLRSMLPLTGEADWGERWSRWRPALIVAAACREDKDGERGEGGPGCVAMESAPARDMRRVPCDRGEADVEMREV